MDKGWGLTLGSDPPISFTKPPLPNSNSSSSSSSSFSRINRKFDMFQFPVNLAQHQAHHQPVAASASASALSPATDEDHCHRMVVDELDFFTEKKRAVADDDAEDCHDNKTSVKKENSLGDVPRSLDVNTGLHLHTANTGSDQSTVDDGMSSEVDDKRSKSELAQLQVELQRMNTENQKLRDMLTQVSNNYTVLQMHFVAFMQQQQQHQQNHGAQSAQEPDQREGKSEEKKQEVVPRQFLDLGPSAETDAISHSSSDERTRSASPQANNSTEVASVRNNGKLEMVSYDGENSGRRIGREESPESESHGWNPNKSQKLNPANNNKSDDQSTEATMRKARVSVRARSEAPMITDGCQWRKYGQKMAKGNPCPRAYYRCTMAVGCPVRKQVQRCAEDRSILITTYEGNHNHPLPPAAMAMASTTTAAATMLLSGSMSSADGIMNPNLLARAILPCSSSMATISASAPFPTVTLDLTQNPNPLQSQRHPTQFQVPFPGQPQNFVSVPNAQLPRVFGQALYSQSKFSGLQLSQDMGTSQLGHQVAAQQPSAALHQQQQVPSLVDTVSAATAAITADPNFTAALAAAITSIIGGANNNSNSSNNNNSNSNTSNRN